MTPRSPALLACAAALAALVTVALAQQLCETSQFGSRSAVPMIRGVRRVKPGMFTLEINDSDVCGEAEAVGLRVTACDADTAPRVLLLDAARGMVVRAGALAGAALVYSTVYCAAPAADDALQPAADYPDQPAADTPTPTGTTSPSPLLSLSTQDSPPLSKIEPEDESLPPINLESRISSMDKFNGPFISNSLSSRLKDMWKNHFTSPRFQENEQSLLNKAKHQPSMFDPYSTFIKSFPKSSSTALPKRLIGLRPKQQNNRLENRAPSWKRRPTRRPSSPWLKLRSLSDDETRKAMPPSSRRTFDSNDPWSPYEDDPISLQWTDDKIDSIAYTRGDLPFRQNKPSKTRNLNGSPRSASDHDRPSPSSIKHDSQRQSRFVPPIHEEDPALLMEWEKNQPRSKRPTLPKLLLLLHDEEHEEPIQNKYSAHSVEDTDSWWLNKPNKNSEDEGIPWQPDYPADYTADDGDARSWNYIDGRIRPSYVALAKKRGPPRPHRHRAIPPAQPVPHASHYKPPPKSKALPAEKYFYYSPTPLTERPLLISTVRNSLPWIKNSNATPLKLPLTLKKSRQKRLFQKPNHHHPRHHNYPPDHRFQTKPLLQAENNYTPETYNPSHLQPNPFSEAEQYFSSEPHVPPGPQLPSGHQLPTEPHYPPETHNPSHLQPNPFSDAESHLPSDPYYPSNPYNPSEPYYPLEHNYLSESGNIQSEPLYPPEPNYLAELEYPPELGNDPSQPQYPSEPNYALRPYYPPESDHPPEHHYSPEPHYRPGSEYPLDPDYPSEHHYSPDPHYPHDPYVSSYPDYPLQNHYPPETGNFPSKPYYPTEPHYPTDPYYPPDYDYPNEPYYPSELHDLLEPQYPPGPHYSSGPQVSSDPHYPSKQQYPSKHHYPPKQRYPSGSHHPSGEQFPSETNDLSQYLQSSAPWEYLSELLLSHPSFRDSTHVIRIR